MTKLPFIGKLCNRLEKFTRLLTVYLKKRQAKDPNNENINLLIMAVQYLHTALEAIKQYQKNEETRRRALN